jgi:hypothetical protein
MLLWFALSVGEFRFVHVPYVWYSRRVAYRAITVCASTVLVGGGDGKLTRSEELAIGSLCLTSRDPIDCCTRRPASVGPRPTRSGCCGQWQRDRAWPEEEGWSTSASGGDVCYNSLVWLVRHMVGK